MAHSRWIPPIVCLVAGLLGAAPAGAQSSAGKPSPWDPMRYFVGTWTGSGSGQPGVSAIERDYVFVLGERFLEVRNKSTYRILGPDEFVERFELAEPGGDFAVYSEARLKRKR